MKNRERVKVVNRIRHALEKKGDTQEQIAAALMALNPAHTKPVKVKRYAVNVISDLLTREGRCVVIAGRKGDVKVYGWGSYTTLQKTSGARAKVVKPWLKSPSIMNKKTPVESPAVA